MDLGGRSFADPPLPSIKPSIATPLPTSASEDFTEKINQWIHFDSGKNTKEVSEEASTLKSNKVIGVGGKANGRLSTTQDSIPKVIENKHNTKVATLTPSNLVTKEAEPKRKFERKKNFSCKKCEFVASSKGDLSAHRDEHKKTPLVCKTCSKTFKPGSYFELKMHGKRHGEPTIPCKICHKLFKLEGDLNAHMKTHTNEHFFKCEKCDKALTSRRNLRMHVMKIHEKARPFSCQMCSKIYSKHWSLQVHIRSVHTGEKPFKCPQCSKRFASSSILSVHLGTHSSTFKYNCTICKKKFRSFANLFCHKRIHLKEKSFTCADCKVQFQSQLSLLKHKLTHKMFTQPMKCRHCEQIFELKEAYELHMLRAHKQKVKIAEINVKKFKIPTSNKINYGASNLNDSNSLEIRNQMQHSFITRQSILKTGENDSSGGVKSVRLLNIPIKLKKTHQLPVEIASQSFKLKPSSPSNKQIIINRPSPTLIQGAKTAQARVELFNPPQYTGGGEAFSRPHTTAYLTSSNADPEKDTENFLQASDIHLTDFPLRFSFSSKDNVKQWPVEELRSSSENLSDKDLPLKCDGSLKLVEHINNFSYNLHASSFESNNGDKTDSSFIDTFPKSNEEDNVDKFLFDDISDFVE